MALVNPKIGSTTSSASDDVNRPTRIRRGSRHIPSFSLYPPPTASPTTIEGGGGGGKGSEIFGVLCERLNARVYGIVFSCDSWPAWGWNNTKLETRRGLIGARLILNKNYDGAGRKGGGER